MNYRCLHTKLSLMLLSRRSCANVTACKKKVWSEDNVVLSPHKSVEIPNMTLVDYIWEKISRFPNKTAVVCGVTNRSYSYLQVYKYSRNLAARLRIHFHVRDGDVICVMMNNIPEFPIAVLGSLQAGAQVTTTNPMYTAYEVHKQLLLSYPKVIISTANSFNVIRDALKMAKLNIPIILTKTVSNYIPEGTVHFEEVVHGTHVNLSILKDVKRKPEDVALLLNSSGTTGLPKGVELLNRNLVANFVQTDGISYFKSASETCQDSVLSVLPFYHIYGLCVIMLYRFTLGAKIVSIPKFQPSTFLNALQEHKISVLPVVPSIVSFLVSDSNVTKRHLEHVHSVTCGAAPLQKHEFDKLLDKTSSTLKLSQIYGLTETSPLVTIDSSGSNNYGAAGVPLPNTELKIIGDNHQTLGPNEVGELLIRGPQIMKGYRNNPKATKDCIDEDGWFHSGDLCSLSENKVLTIHGRLKELIKVKGYQVPPAELESVLKDHPSILDAAVLGIPDMRLGEAPKAFIVLKDGQKPNSTNIIKFVKERVADYKQLKEVVFIDNVPRNDTGKILRNVLKERYS